MYVVNKTIHNPTLDKIMIAFSDHVFLAVPVLLALLYFVYRKNWDAIKTMFLMGIAIGLLDSFCTFVLKENIQRLRPCKALDWVRVVHRCGGMFGYVSNHAANSFALATFLFIIIRSNYRYIFFVISSIIAFSRVYLGVHYPFDVISGALLGCLWAFIFYRLYMSLGGIPPQA